VVEDHAASANADIVMADHAGVNIGIERVTELDHLSTLALAQTVHLHVANGDNKVMFLRGPGSRELAERAQRQTTQAYDARCDAVVVDGEPNDTRAVAHVRIQNPRHGAVTVDDEPFISTHICAHLTTRYM
jgi:hypothetical protein